MTNSTKIRFDYESKIWGLSKITNKFTNFQGLDLTFFEKAIKNYFKPNWQVLDLGSGAGNIAGYLKSKYKNWKITGLDVSKNAINLASKKYKSVMFKLVDARKLTSKNIDLIYAFDTLEHFDSLDKVIKNVNKSLKDGGIFYVAIPLEKQFPTLYYFLNKLGWEGKKIRSGHINVFDDKEFISLVEKNGFKLVNKKYSYHFLMTIFDIVFYFFQNLINKSIAFESTVSESNNIFLKFIKNSISIISYVESTIFSKVVGGKGHFLFIKTDKNDFFSANPPLTVAEEFQIKHGFKKVVQPRDLEIIKLLKKLDFNKANKILDFGCANGVWLERMLSKNKKNGIGVDIANKLIEYAKSRKNAKGKYFLTNTNWPVSKNSIDFCYSFDTFEHIKNKEDEVKNISESMKKGGKILIYTLNPNNKYTIDWFFEMLGSDFMYKRADHDKKLFISPQKMRDLLIKYDFYDAEFVLYDGPVNLVGRIFGYTLAKFGFTELNDKLIRFIYPLNIYLDNLILRKGYSNGYFLWATKK